MRDEIKKVFCGILVCLLVAVLLPVNAIASRGDMCLGGNGCSNGNVCHNGNVCQNQGELSKVACKSLAKMKIRYAKVKNDNSQVTVGWYKVKNSTHTLIYRKSVGEKWKFIGKVKSTTVKFVDKNPLDGTNFYKVRAYNSRSKVYGKFSYSKKVVLKHVHNFGAWKAISPSTCTHDGERARYCYICQEKESIVLPKLNRQHQFELLVTHPELGCATYKCKYCRETEFRDL